MSPELELISAALITETDGVAAAEKWQECTRLFPWYPLPWLVLAEAENQSTVQKAGLWFSDEARLNYHINHAPNEADTWLNEELDRLFAEGKMQEEPVAEHTVAALSGAESPGAEKPVSYFIDDEEPEPLEEEGELLLPDIKISFDKSPAVKDNSPLFEPYHAVDYFASQGIKAEPIIPKEKFEKQVKSFTQWLKTMKRVTLTNTPAYADPMVEAQAVQSNTGKEVVTEAMAQVLEKQGRFDKAAAIYEKLLLLHPEKGPLFAARIEDLKSIKQ